MSVREYKGIIIDDSRDEKFTQFGKKTLEERYLLENETFQELFARVATHFSDSPAHAQRMYDYMSRHWFMPSTPILSNGGTDRGLAISCFLNETNDSLDGMWDLYRENMRLAAAGGGIGSYWSNVRSIGERAGSSGKTSGVIPFIKAMDSQTLAVSQGSLRRGSAAVYMQIDHPEIEEFLQIRKPSGGDPNRKCLNLHHGICITDDFMHAVENDDMWALRSPKTREVIREVSARTLFARILETRIETGEPYLLFIDTVNRAIPEWHRRDGYLVKTSNLCLAGNTRIVTNRGMKTLEELYQEQSEFEVSSDLRTLEGAQVRVKRYANGSHVQTEADLGVGQYRSSRVIKTSDSAEVFKITTFSGYTVTGTADHAVMTDSGWKRIGDLVENDKMFVQSGEGVWSTDDSLPELQWESDSAIWKTRHERDPINLPIKWNRELGILMGWIVGDGYIDHNRNWASWVIGNEEYGLESTLLAMIKNQFGVEADVQDHGSSKHLIVRDRRVGEFLKQLGVSQEYSDKKTVPTSIWTAPREAVMGFLQGLFTADGTVNRTREGCTVRVASTSHTLLEQTQVLLTNFGIVGTIYKRRDHSRSLLPDGRGNQKFYDTLPFWELVIGKRNRNNFVDQIGFLTEKKQSKVVEFVSQQTKRGSYRELFEDRIISIVREEDQAVYDIVVENSHSFIANGLVVHNCSEIVLPTSTERTAVCCLSSLNLETYKEWRKDQGFIIDVMRFLDNVLQDFIDQTGKNPKFAGLKKANFSASQERSVGLGVMGFHSFLQQMNVPFESDNARHWNQDIWKRIKAGVDEASRMIAREKGPCPDAARHGFVERFSNKTSVAPTASISIITGGASPGIEPMVANAYTHKTLSGSFLVKNQYLEKVLEKYGRNDQETWSSIIVNRGSVQHLGFLNAKEKELFKTATELDQNWIIRHAADRAPFIDQAASNNLFFRADADKSDVLSAHFLAWKEGVKSLYYCRSQSLQRASNVGQKIERVKIIDDSPPDVKPRVESDEERALSDMEKEEERFGICEACQ